MTHDCAHDLEESGPVEIAQLVKKTGVICDRLERCDVKKSAYPGERKELY